LAETVVFFFAVEAVFAVLRDFARVFARVAPSASADEKTPAVLISTTAKTATDRNSFLCTVDDP
jgi:hypothetical protein